MHKLHKLPKVVAFLPGERESCILQFLPWLTAKLFIVGAGRFFDYEGTELLYLPSCLISGQVSAFRIHSLTPLSLCSRETSKHPPGSLPTTTVVDSTSKSLPHYQFHDELEIARHRSACLDARAPRHSRLPDLGSPSRCRRRSAGAQTRRSLPRRVSPLSAVRAAPN